SSGVDMQLTAARDLRQTHSNETSFAAKFRSAQRELLCSLGRIGGSQRRQRLGVRRPSCPAGCEQEQDNDCCAAHQRCAAACSLSSSAIFNRSFASSFGSGSNVSASR